MELINFMTDLIFGLCRGAALTLWNLLTQPWSFLLLTCAGLLFVFDLYRYKKTAYAAVTHNSYFRVMHDTGLRGEYEIFRRLSFLEAQGGRFLFNLYLPKDGGETTEADVLLLLPEGIFVFESKNYSGWIFGNGAARMWTQTLPNRKGKAQKEQFYNPIRQNEGHIRALRTLIGDEISVQSVIVFSERCTLKCIENTENIPVIRRSDIEKTMQKLLKNTVEKPLSEVQIGEIYKLLYPFTQVTQETKLQHIKDIKQKHD